MPNYHTILQGLLKDLKRAKKRAVRDQRRILYLGLGNPAFSAATVLWGYVSSIPNASTVAIVMAVVKDTSIWSAIFKRVEAYWRENGRLSIELLRFKSICDGVLANDKEGYEQAKAQLLEFYNELKQTYSPTPTT